MHVIVVVWYECRCYDNAALVVCDKQQVHELMTGITKTVRGVKAEDASRRLQEITRPVNLCTATGVLN